MPFVSCNTFNASQAAQDSAILALQGGGGVTNTAVVNAVNLMTAAQLSAMCAKLNCAPTAAALTSSLLSLAGSGTAGNVLTVVNGAPVWQPPVAGAAASVPATGVTAGALPSGVTMPASQVTGFGAEVLNAIPTSTDGVVGKSRSSTPLETGIGQNNDGVHVSPADLLAAITAPAVSGVFNPLQMGVRGQIPYYLFTKQPISGGAGRQEIFVDAGGKLWGDFTIYGTSPSVPIAAPNSVNSNVTPKTATTVLTASGETYIWNGSEWAAITPNKYGTFASVLAPTAAPTAANPQTILTNSNGEVFAWSGAGWVYIGGGAYQLLGGIVSDSVAPTVLDGTFTHTTAPITLTNPSSTRILRVTFSDLGGYFYNSATPVTSSFLISIVSANDIDMAFGGVSFANTPGPIMRVYNNSFHRKPIGQFDIYPGLSCNVTMKTIHAINPGGGNATTLNNSTEHFVSAGYTTQFI